MIYQYVDFIQAYVSMKRITKILEEDELDIDAVKRDPWAENALEIVDGIFTWGGENQVQHLKK